MNENLNNKAELCSLAYRLWIKDESNDSILGDGKIRLLEEIDKQKSISRASREFGMSYRKAWGDIKKAELLLGFSLTKKTRGGRSGGGTVLSEEGRELIKEYRKMQLSIGIAAKAAFKEFKENLKNK